MRSPITMATLPQGRVAAMADSGSWNPGRTPQSTYTIGMLVAFAAISMFFLALVSASVVHRGMPGSDWVPFEPPSILWGTSALAILQAVLRWRARDGRLRRETTAHFPRWWTRDRGAWGVFSLQARFLPGDSLRPRAFTWFPIPVSVSFTFSP